MSKPIRFYWLDDKTAIDLKRVAMIQKKQHIIPMHFTVTASLTIIGRVDAYEYILAAGDKNDTSTVVAAGDVAFKKLTDAWQDYHNWEDTNEQ